MHSDRIPLKKALISEGNSDKAMEGSLKAKDKYGFRSF